MRPHELRLIAFRSYDDETIDFREHRLVVIAGQTGAGKTSILDGICFALYGRTPEIGGPRELLTLGAAHGEVQLTFTAAGELWRVSRRFGKGAPEPGHLLERLDERGDTVDRVAGAAQVNQRIGSLVGMTFQAFTSAVLLAQGRFAQFLQASPKERDAILRELFGIASLDGVRAAALVARDVHERTAAERDSERAALPGHAAGRRNALARAVRSSATRLVRLESLRPLADSADLAHARATEASAAAKQIRDALAELPPASDRASLAERHNLAAARAEEARAIRGDAQRALDDAIGARDRLREQHGGTAAELAALRAVAERAAIAHESVPRELDALARREEDLTRQRDRLARRRADLAMVEQQREAMAGLAAAFETLAEARAALAGARDAAESTRAARDAARDAARTATDEANIADAALDELRHAHLASRLRTELSPGDTCPVCGQAVHTVPAPETEDLHDVEEGVAALNRRAATAAAALAELESDLRRATRDVEHAEEAVRQCELALTSRGGDTTLESHAVQHLVAEAERLARERATADAELTELSNAIEREAGSLAEASRRMERDRAEIADLEGRLGIHASAGDPVAVLDSAVRELEMLEQSVIQSSRYTTQVSARAAAAEEALHTLERDELAGLRHALTILATRLGMDPPPPELPPADLPVHADELARKAERAASDADARAAAASVEAVRLDAEIGSQGAPLGVATRGDVAPRLRAARESAMAARDALADIERTAAAGRQLAARAASARREAEIASQLAQDLQANRFPRFLLARFHERLAVGATARLLALSHGAFSFAGSDPDPLAVVDHRHGNLLRGAATLSGGERFLASLALALALADIASGSAGRLECLFLDEGFSSLDQESLELAIAGVERMADDGRLVVVITHLPGVADRLGAAIHIRKDAAGVSRVAAVVASAGRQ